MNLNASQVKRPTIAQVCRATADHYGLSWLDLVEPCRKRHISEARHVAMYLSHAVSKRGCIRIGRAMERDHTTVSYAVRKVKARVGADWKFALTVSCIAGKALAEGTRR